MQTLELTILNWIQAQCRSGFLDALMPAVSALCAHGEIWIVLAAVLLIFPRTRRVGGILAAALILDVICCNGILKPLIARVRPCDVNPAAELLVRRPSDWSFPSGHAASSFAATAALYAAGCRGWIPAFALSLLICFSRLYLYVHWPSDVLAGAILGVVLGFLAQKLYDKVAKKMKKTL
ncbi:MAG: phosphatase PAP2 family protein [Oscillibacter sp.]|jgi:undecaprenyl-diphosphatase|nr:phosphatase PAP2 family protein [Oscillibacter sp.]